METMSSTNTHATSLAKKAMKMALPLLKKAISTTNLVFLLLLLKRGSKLAVKAVDCLLLKHAAAFLICGASISPSDNDVSVVGSCPPFKEVEFSCSNSPAAFQFLLPGKLRRRHQLHHRRYQYRVDEAAVAAAVQRVFDMLNSTEVAGEGPGSAAVTPMLLPGFGKSPALPVRQLRVTDSPFPVKENEEESKQVSKAAEDFIRRFYTDLKREKSFDSPYRHSHYH